MGIDDLANDCEAKAGAGHLGREERVEDLVGHVRRHPGAVVRDIDDHRRRRRQHADKRRIRFDRAGRRRDRDVPPAVERFERVRDQIGEHLRELVMVAFDHRQPRLDVRRDDHLAAPRFRLRHRHRLLQDVG